MYNSDARQDLDEMLGYERYVLRECGDAIRSERGTSGPVRLVINDAEPNWTLVSVGDTLGDVGAGMVREMSPLVFAASFKILDMIFTWIIAENNVQCSFRFCDKINVITGNATIAYPDFLSTDNRLREVVIALYTTLTPYRNAIIHDRWGRAQQGDLSFNFTYRGVPYVRDVPFNEVLSLADFAELLGTLLVEASCTGPKLDSLRSLCDKLKSFHGRPLFEVLPPRYFDVIRNTTMPANGHLSVDLIGVRQCVATHSFGNMATFDLTVVADASPRPFVWKIPFSHIPSVDTVILDETWEQWLTVDGGVFKSLVPFMDRRADCDK